MMPRRAFIALTALLFLAAPALAADDEPVALVRAIYAVQMQAEKTRQNAWEPPHRDRFFSRALGPRITRTIQGSGIDFDFILDGQDFDIKDLNVALVRRQGHRAAVAAQFKNFNEPKRVTYQLVRESGGWRVAEISTSGKHGWVLTKLLDK